MNRKIAQHYLKALNESDLDKVLALFTDDAVIISPLYGEMSARSFYQALFADTQKSETQLLNSFHSIENPQTLGLHFRYTWTLQSGEVVSFEVVDVFELSEDQTRFSKLTIIYDTYQIRDAHSHSQDVSHDR